MDILDLRMGHSSINVIISVKMTTTDLPQPEEEVEVWTGQNDLKQKCHKSC